MSQGEPSYQPLGQLASLFQANLAALEAARPHIARQLGEFDPSMWGVCAADGQVKLAQRSAEGWRQMPQALTPMASKETAEKIFPNGRRMCAVLVAGVDQGWLWHALYTMPCEVPALPGHRPPLYFLARGGEHLALALHLHDWRQMLADPSVQLFVGADAVEQVARSMQGAAHCPWPKVAVTLDPVLWTQGRTLDSLLVQAAQAAEARFAACQKRLVELYRCADEPGALAARLQSEKSLKILGITSRYTTFLQYSMRDWLAGFEELGHQTKLVIEQEDFHSLSNLHYAQACAEFVPDIILLIDHARCEFKAFPPNIPFVMWVQDMLPNILSAPAGAGQNRTDYVLGYGRTDCIYKYGYPARRFMSSMIGVNPRRFSPPAQRGGYACDVSFVSHCSTPAAELLAEELQKQPDAQLKKLLSVMYEKLAGVYQSGGYVVEPMAFEQLLRQSMEQTQTRLQDPAGVLDFFTQRINNALFRHQALNWLVELDIDLRLYGRGWEAHPTFKRYARGVADNQKDLAEIYHTSRICLHIAPWGSAHQRVFDGLAAGAFFLFRGHGGELNESDWRELWRMCQAENIQTDQEFGRRATPPMRQLLARIVARTQDDPFASSYGPAYDFLGELRDQAEMDFTRSASTLWPEYSQVAFFNRDDLHEKIRRFLPDDAARQTIARSMRQTVVDKLSYLAICKRLLRFIDHDLAAGG